ncbi:heparinase II/III family protein [Desulfosarcina sp.]|uniref:heparinase II/III domain-containing protein n=1 Tax=Desulfosarcina sp. TaxID=2027861 RepID=UPI0039709DB1
MGADASVHSSIVDNHDFILKADPVLNLRFYLMRLRHASFAELCCRIRQYLARLHLQAMVRFDSPLLGDRAVNLARIDGTHVPDLLVERNGASADLLNGPAAIADAFKADIRLRWEPARLQLASCYFARAGRPSGKHDNAVSGQAAGNLILSWLDANPFPRGEHYQSAMECALRIPVFFYALKHLEHLSSDHRDRMLQALYLHARLVANHLSLYSSLGNHTVTEAIGLVFAGAIYRSMRTGGRWLKTGLRILDEELPHQILEDGGPAEQSLGYHRFVLDLYWLAMDFVHKNDLADLNHWRPRLARGQHFLDVFQDQNGIVPAIGDSDDGAAVAPGISPRRETSDNFKANRATFPDSGYSVINDGRLIFTFDHGPLGMAPFYNHGHADALSITLSMNGRPLIVDPGTYRYNGVEKWRRYFKGTRAHNTVTIDDQDQAVQETSFIWSNPYHSKLVASEEVGSDLFCSAVHDGYARLKAPVQHQRSISCFDQGNFLIKDRFSGSGVYRFELNFHLHPDAIVKKNGPWWVVDHGGESAFLHLLEFDFQVVRGQVQPLLGWYSNRYGYKEPTCTLTCSRSGKAADIVFTTAIFTRMPLHLTGVTNEVD